MSLTTTRKNVDQPSPSLVDSSLENQAASSILMLASTNTSSDPRSNPTTSLKSTSKQYGDSLSPPLSSNSAGASSAAEDHLSDEDDEHDDSENDHDSNDSIHDIVDTPMSTSNIHDENSVSANTMYPNSKDSRKLKDGKGTIGFTRAIRSKLNFTNDSQWKKFSARRLELIDSMALSTKKASEQDEEIKNVANTLRIEFGFPDDALEDFDKLVKAAIQSARRNRKRLNKNKNQADPVKDKQSSKKTPRTRSRSNGTRANSTTTGNDDMDIDEPLPSQQVPTSPCHSGSSSRTREKKKHRFVVYTSDNNGTDARLSADENLSDIVVSQKRRRAHSKSHTYTPSRFSDNSSIDDTNMNVNSTQKHSVPIGSLVNNKFPVRQSLPSISSLTVETPTTRIQSSKQKLLLYLRRSRSCASPEKLASENLGFLGSSAISATVAFVMERYFSNLAPFSIEKLRSKLVSDASLSAIVRNLNLLPTNPTIECNDHKLTAKYFRFLIGSCIRDFGFDNVIFALSDIFHEILNEEYPPSKLALLSAPEVPQPPQNNEQTPMISVIKPVTLKFMSQVLHFTYAPLNSPPPTIHELIENGKTAFHILSDSKVLRLRDLIRNEVVYTDTQLEQLFKRDKVELDLFFPPVLQQQRPSRDTIESPGIILPDISHMAMGMPPKFDSTSISKQSPSPTSPPIGSGIGGDEYPRIPNLNTRLPHFQRLL